MQPELNEDGVTLLMKPISACVKDGKIIVAFDCDDNDYIRRLLDAEGVDDLCRLLREGLSVEKSDDGITKRLADILLRASEAMMSQP